MASIARTDGGPVPAHQGEASARLTTALLALFASLLGFTLLKHGTDFIAIERPELVFAWVAVVGTLAASFAPARYDVLPRFAVRCLRAGAVFLGLYMALEPFAIPYAALPADHPAVVFHSHARWIGVGLAFAGLLRPSFVFAAAMLLWMVRELQTGLTGFYFSTLDIRNIAEVLAFWAIGFTILAAARRVKAIHGAIGLDGDALKLAALMLFAAGVGAHLANYFWSGLAKLALDGGIFSWLLDNRLYDGIPGALEKGTLPLAGFPLAVQWLDTVLRFVSIPANIAAFAVQIFALFAPLKRRWLIMAVVGFDLFHIAVWFALGLLFWKWIALNAILLVALSAISEDEWRPAARYTAVAFVIAGMATFRTASLAWYDTPGFTSPHFEAEMADGSRMAIPNAYFLSSSYQVSQGRIWWPGGEGHFNPSIWGSVLSHEDLVAGRECKVPQRAMPAEEEWGPAENIGRFVQAHHRQVATRLDDRGRFNYYLVPHHHVPSPFKGDAFYTRDKRQIVRYWFVVESVCLSLDKGGLDRRVLKRTERPVYDVKADRIVS
ncbi:hypothetical protein [Croceicoccus bisphenolivorans]|uniref:hypothetical protein n=1 Tax=Croceicoccus bisphenolivorans TaxID=1783232 RepID=UPI000829FAAB|nr:hypothetical protein [Croceicoccus bisphenolivorans]